MIPDDSPRRRVSAYRSASRFVQFMFTGTVAGLLQIYLLTVFTRSGWLPLIASVVASLCGAQLNFVLSSLITWRDRPAAVFWQRWLLYHGSIAGTVVLNVLVFSMLHMVFPTVVASAGGILVAGMINFVLGNNLVFRLRVEKPLKPERQESVA